MRLRIDGRAVEAVSGATILEAASTAGIEIPALCHHPALPPDGSCRLCLVEVGPMRHLLPACTAPAAEGLDVRTETPALAAERRHVLRLVLRRYNPGVGKRDHELLALARRLDLPVPADPPPPPEAIDESDPFLRVDHAACIRCWRCVRACDLLNGVHAIGVFGRGADNRIGFGDGGAMRDSSCESCGMCEAVCPTDAITVKGRPARAPERRVSTVCSYCGVGCRVTLEVSGNQVDGTAVEWAAPANHGLLCVKGRFGWEYLHHADRLRRPLVRASLLGRGGAEFIETDWETALDVVARRLVEIRERDGSDALAVLASAKCTNEENYLAQKLARQLLGTNHVDHCARLCHAPSVVALGAALGSGAMTNSMDDIVEHARCVLVVGSNTTAQHPVLGMRLRRAVRQRGLPIVVVDPRRTPIADMAVLHLALRPGTDATLLSALAHVLMSEGWIDRAFIDAQTEGFEAFAASVRHATPERAAEITGVRAGDIRAAARLLWEHRPGALLFAMGVTQHTCGTDNAFACVNLQLLLGNLGVPGAGVNPLRGQNNVQGSSDMGALPDVLPGYQPVDDPAARARFEAGWGAVLPARPGLTVTEILDATLAGRIRALYVMGENPAMTDPDLSHVRQCLAAAELLVSQELFLSETARFAHVVLPAAGTAEKDGSVTNTDRRVQRLGVAVEPPGEARPDWWILAEVGRRLAAMTPGLSVAAPHSGWAIAGPEEVMEEIAALTPSYGGIRLGRLGARGLQWPCPTSEHSGTSVLHVGGAMRGRARFTPVGERPPAEIPSPDFPLVLTTGRLLEHYHAGTMTRRVAGLAALAPEAVAEMHPGDAAACGAVDGVLVWLRTRRGAVRARLRVTEHIVPGTVFLPFHFAEAAANELTHAALDPAARIPEYKVCAVDVESDGD